MLVGYATSRVARPWRVQAWRANDHRQAGRRVICRHRHLPFFVVRAHEGVPRSPCALVSARPHPQPGKQMLVLSSSQFDPQQTISVARRSPSEPIDGRIAVAKATSPCSTCVVCRRRHTQRGAFSLGALTTGGHNRTSTSSIMCWGSE